MTPMLNSVSVCANIWWGFCTYCFQFLMPGGRVLLWCKLIPISVTVRCPSFDSKAKHTG